MPLMFARTNGGRNRATRAAARRSAAQGCLWDPTVVGRTFGQSAMTFRSGEQALRERLEELELRRRRAQIKARRAIEGRLPEPYQADRAAAAQLPFAS